MARIRTIKPEFWKDEDLSELPEFVHMLAAALLNYADDEGYFNANHRLVRAECCPLREPSVSVHDALNQLASVGYLELGEGEDGKRYGRVVWFTKHQKINRPTGSKIKGLAISWEDSRTAHGALNEISLPEQGTGNREQGKEKEGEASPPAPRAPQATRLPDDWHPGNEGMAWAHHQGVPDPERELAKFTDYWTAKGGKDARKTNWLATWRNWCRRAADDAMKNRPQGTTNGKRPDHQNTADAAAARRRAALERHGLGGVEPGDAGAGYEGPTLDGSGRLVA